MTLFGIIRGDGLLQWNITKLIAKKCKERRHSLHKSDFFRLIYLLERVGFSNVLKMRFNSVLHQCGDYHHQNRFNGVLHQCGLPTPNRWGIQTDGVRGIAPPPPDISRTFSDL
jgi:hypothetical protein